MKLMKIVGKGFSWRSFRGNSWGGGKKYNHG